MKLSQEHMARLSDFIDQIENETYPEEPSELHTQITFQLLNHFFLKYTLPQRARVLDVGCGQGVALQFFHQRELDPIGITLNSDDARICKEKGFDVYQMDQSFLDFPEQIFDLIWNRHCIEHSIFPYFTLHEMCRVLKPGGYLYIEVPAPDTSANHQTNPNHYSVMGNSMWQSLIERSGFTVCENIALNFTTMAGAETYWSFIVQKK